ncbi:hypothetical protein MZO42_04380 [Sphingomonas psychrotolerans]|uniref:Uncharacterized protein n=1 Tax=Sphingomonas psychrotolerans TaxID=1327635 RepID=A0ABU3N3R9_9SPHN|nr:hypothetical protein [Sphingomonas psychrotolerans]MDT8757925.1 hypothetical protein [Sphingomonas psychrotolerans]
MRHLLFLPLLCAAAPAFAQVEELDQIEPGKSEWQAELLGSYGGTDDHQIELITGVTDQLVLGVQAEFEGRRLEGWGPVALYRFSDPEEKPVGLAGEVQIEIDRGGHLGEAELRGIVERQTRAWWLQANVMLRYQRDEGERGTNVAYATSVQHALGDKAWLGIEASGRALRLGGSPEAAPQGEHYAGPSLTLELAEEKLELGAAWLQRLSGEGPNSEPRVFVQFTF